MPFPFTFPLYFDDPKPGRSVEFKVIIQRDDVEKDKYYPKLISAYTNSTFPWSCPTATIEVNTNISTGTAGYMSPVRVDDIIRLQANVRTTSDEKSVWQDIFEGRIMKIESRFGRDNPTTLYCRGHGEELLYRAVTTDYSASSTTTGSMLDTMTTDYLSRLTDASPSLIDTAGSTSIADYNIQLDTKYIVDVVRQFESLESYGYILSVVPEYDSSDNLSAAYVSWQAVPSTASDQVQIREGTPRLIDATFSYSIEQLVEDVTVYGASGTPQKAGNSADGSPAYGTRYHVETDLTLATDQLCSDLADAIRAQYDGMDMGNAKILGDPNIKVGDLIYCRIPSIELNGSTIDGNYRCRRVSHQISTENWFTYVDLGELDISTWDFIAGFQVKSRLENANAID